MGIIRRSHVDDARDILKPLDTIDVINRVKVAFQRLINNLSLTFNQIKLLLIEEE